MNEKIIKAFKEAEQDKKFIKMLFEQDSPEKIQAVLSSKGINLNLEEVKQLVCSVVNNAEIGNGELGEESLDNVSGGIVISTLVGYACCALLAGGGIVIGWKAAKGKC